jgi:hypothetical protein
MLFCNIFFPPNNGAGYFFPQFVRAGIFFVQNGLAGNFFQNHPPFLSKVKFRPLKKDPGIGWSRASSKI